MSAANKFGAARLVGVTLNEGVGPEALHRSADVTRLLGRLLGHSKIATTGDNYVHTVPVRKGGRGVRGALELVAAADSLQSATTDAAPVGLA